MERLENTILTIFMSVVWTSWKLPIFIKFHQKFHTPEVLIRGPRSNLDLPTASEAFAPSEVATTDLAPNARPVRLPASPHLPDLGKPTGHHQLVHRVLLHNRSTVALLRSYSGA